MSIQLAQWILLILLFSCLASFVWAIRAFFVQPAGTTPAMRITGASGTVSAVLHACAIVFSRGIPIERAALASVLYAAALALFWWAVSANRKKPLSAIFSPDLPIHMVSYGPYRYVRHPLYTAYIMTWTAGLIATFAWWLIPTVVLMAAIYIRAARVEEAKFLRSELAKPYDEYRSRTGRFTPAPWKTFSKGHSRAAH
jgi:protein-S-isoprenylcysteine O-methyltransferase Ste14